MKKLMRSKLVQVLFLVIAITGGVLAYSAYRKHKLTQFVMWSPRAKIIDYEFIANHKAVAISWDNEAELKEAKEAKKYDPRIKVGNMMRISGERYIVQQSYKLKSASYKYWEFEKDKVPFLTSNIPESGEYWLLDIYDTKGGRIKQKTYDVFKMVREYNKEYIPRKIPEYKRYLYTEQGRVYLPINMVITRNSELKSEMGLIDIEAGKIVESTPSGKTANLFSKKDSFAYKVINSENGMITNGKELLDLESEFIPVGKSVYEDLYIPSKWSINGKDQKIVSYDQIQEYYNGEIEKRSLIS